MEMMFGSAIHDGLSGKLSDAEVEAYLQQHHFTGDYIRVANEILKKKFDIIHKELKLYIDWPDFSLACVLDGLNEDEIVEHKTTKNGWRTQQDVDDHGQLTLYALAHQILTGVIPRITLNRLDTGNGRVKTYTSTRNGEQLNAMMNELVSMYKELKELGWWHRRQMRSEFYIKECKADTQKFLLWRNTLQSTTAKS